MDPGATLSIVSPNVASRFNKTPKCLPKTFSVFTHIGDIVLAERVYKDCSMTMYQRIPCQLS